jgi:hypothetical protein
MSRSCGVGPVWRFVELLVLYRIWKCHSSFNRRETMTTDIASLNAAAVTIGFLHCVCGPDYYVPFVAMSRVGSWSLRKTLAVTILCGIGHIAGSVVLGFINIGELDGFRRSQSTS